MVGLCSEIFVRLSYYMEAIAGIELTPVRFSEQKSSTLQTTPLALSSKFITDLTGGDISVLMGAVIETTYLLNFKYVSCKQQQQHHHQQHQ